MIPDRPSRLSVIVITPSTFEVVRKTVRHLAAQKVSRDLELLVVAPSDVELDASDVAGAFGRVRTVPVGPIRSTGEATAAAVRVASTPLVTYVEEHAYPEPGWAEALIDAHRGPWSAVGVSMVNANPDTAVSWASMLTDFGSWIAPVEGGETDRLPPHNATYKRDVLMEYGNRLGPLLESETVLFRDLLARRHRLYLEPRARVHHVNVSSMHSYALSERLGGRIFASRRAHIEAWSITRRLVYCAASPLIPAVRARRMWNDVRRVLATGDAPPTVVPALAIGFASHTLGEAMGYAFGEGDAARRRTSVELSRFDHVAASDRPEGRTPGCRF